MLLIAERRFVLNGEVIEIGEYIRASKPESFKSVARTLNRQECEGVLDEYEKEIKRLFCTGEPSIKGRQTYTQEVLF